MTAAMVDYHDHPEMFAGPARAAEQFQTQAAEIMPHGETGGGVGQGWPGHTLPFD